MVKLISFWVSDVQEIQKRMNTIILDLDMVRFNDTIKTDVMGNIHSIQRLLSKGKPRRSDVER